MNVVLQDSLSLGSNLISYAYSNRGERIDLSVPDYVGIVAAYLNQGRYSGDIEEELDQHLGERIGTQARKTFEMFNIDGARSGLWRQGPAKEDIRFTSPKIAQRFAKLNRITDCLSHDPR